MKKYKRPKPPKTSGRVEIKGDRDNIVISMSSTLLPSGRVNLFLDEKSFNIHILPSLEGALKINKAYRRIDRRTVNIDGFMTVNKLVPEDLLGSYFTRRTERSIIILYHSRDRGEYKEPMTKITIALPRDMKRKWEELSSIGVSNFVRNAVNRYIEDSYL